MVDTTGSANHVVLAQRYRIGDLVIWVMQDRSMSVWIKAVWDIKTGTSSGGQTHGLHNGTATF